MFYMWWMQTTYWYSAVYQKRGQAPVWKVLWDWLCQGEWQDNALSLASKEGEKDGVILSLCRSKLTPLPPPPPQKKKKKVWNLEVICFDLFGKLELAIGAFLFQDLINNLPCFCFTVLMMLVQRIWYKINQLSPNWCFNFLFSSLACFILYWFGEEKFCLGHSWQLKGKKF